MALAAVFMLLACLFYLPTTFCSIVPQSRYSLLSSSVDSSSDTCQLDGYVSCGSNAPANFCCSSADTCMILSSNTTVVCCPEGESCDLIEPILCNIRLQNVTAFPDSGVYTTRLGDALPTCGDGCCPFGYRCNSDSNCELEDKNGTSESDNLTATTTTAALEDPVTTESSSSSTHKASHTKTSTAESVLPQTTIGDDQVSASPNEDMSQGTRTGLIIGCTITAALVMIILVCILFCYTRRGRNKKRQDSMKNTMIFEKPYMESPRPRERRQHDPTLTKFRTWRGQSYYARADDKMSKVSPRTKIPEPIIEYAELPATPPPRLMSFDSGPDILALPPPIRAKTTRQRFEGTRPGKSQDRWSLR